MTSTTQYIPSYESKVDYIIERIKNTKNIQILELGVNKGISTKKFLNLCELNNGFLTSIDIDDCSQVVKSDKWNFIHSSDDNFELIDKIIPKEFDFLFIDSFHEPNHVEKVFYHYYNFLKEDGICVIDDTSWLPYTKNEYRDNSSNEYTNRKTFQKILEISNQNKESFLLEFLFEGSGLAIITKKKNFLNKAKKITSREFSFKSLIRKIFKITPKK
ncbi:class I SAM-dependent methyltransferase [Candidatus Pelagibacter sp.]|jgi:predicted O-methyltransferase YrrM|nr:class I SAM-dependent methyltransferase [Candidatus Pelagibacter sp.]|tara:strand:- start:142 stop:789 length:648 start_codon:yes stop_codon:yes gene_type:complete